MCGLCHASPCLRGCPNEDIPVYGVCRHCGGEIFKGDTYVELGYRYHEDCFFEMGREEILRVLGIDVETAGE